MIPRPYLPTAQPPAIADLAYIARDPYERPVEPGLKLFFLDGSRAHYPNLSPEDWDLLTPGVVKIRRDGRAHIYSLAHVTYIDWLPHS
jgi:hypothetical protein